jgi:hypothetical protein
MEQNMKNTQATAETIPTQIVNGLVTDKFRSKEQGFSQYFPSRSQQYAHHHGISVNTVRHS